jgi:hypothetical protein
MIKKILFKFQNKTQLIIAMIGAFLGFTFLIISIHYLIRVNEFGQGEEILGNNTMIVQKKVSSYSSINITKTDFSEKEIQNIDEQSFTSDVDPIMSNSFDVYFETNNELIPKFGTDVFVQSINERFIKIDKDKWKWKKGDEFVPIVLPREFITMLNTYASAKGIPQVSDKIAKSVNFRFRLSNKEGKEFQNVKIVGFTSEVSSILVPQSFMEYGNKNYKSKEDMKVTQLMLTVKENEFGKFEEFMEQRSLETKEASKIIGKLKSVAGTMFSILIAISTLTVFLAGLVLVQYAQLLISKNEYEIKTLLRIGYSPTLITRTITGYFIKVFAIISVFSILSFAGLKILIDGILKDGGIQISTNYTILSISAVIIAFGLYTLVNYMNARKGVLKSQ